MTAKKTDDWPSGDPTMFESFWMEVGEAADITIPSWRTLSYFSDVSNFCWFLQPEFAHEARRLHNLVGNAVADDRFLVIGTGSTQLFQAALFALSPSDAPEPMSVVSAVPYYSVSTVPLLHAIYRIQPILVLKTCCGSNLFYTLDQPICRLYHVMKLS